jgi:hypothetical protein
MHARSRSSSFIAVSAAVAIVSILFVARTWAEPKEAAPAKQPPGAAADKGDWTISPPRPLTLPAAHYFHTTFDITFAEMDRIRTEIEELTKALREANVDLFADGAGYMMFTYKGVDPQNPGKPFKMSIGLLVAPGTKAVGKYEVKELPPFKCVGGVFNGPLSSIPAAYAKHYGELVGGGSMPTDESRELFLYWEGEESQNNVVWILAGVQ